MSVSSTDLPAIKSDDDLFDTLAAADELKRLGVRISHHTLRRFRVSGEGPGFLKARSSVFYPRSELLRWVEEQRSPVVRSTTELSALKQQVSKRSNAAKPS